MKLKVAAKALLFHEGKVLIVADPKNKWDFPGGGIEGDERLEEGLRRELQEELGLTDIQVGRVVHADEWFIPKKDLHVVAVFYLAELGEKPMFTLSSEHSETSWIDLKDIGKYDVTEDTIRALEALASAK